MWWGDSHNFEKAIGERPGGVILAFYDKLYIDAGYGNIYGSNYGTVRFWDGIFEMDYLYPNLKSKVLGAVVTLWGEVTDEYTNQQRVWPRSSAMSERTWNGATYYKGYNKTEVLLRLNAQGRRMRSRGIKITPVATQLCESKGVCQ